jgi:predicted translin family RNA/ssDNA-binding protein
MRQLAGIPEGMVYPSGMIALKKKQDTIRALLDRTQGELAVAMATRGLAASMDAGEGEGREGDD